MEYSLSSIVDAKFSEDVADMVLHRFLAKNQVHGDFFSILFESVGLDAEHDIEMVILLGAEQNPAFGEGLFDALYAHTSYLERALVRQEAVILVNQSVGEVTELSGRQTHAMVTTRSFAGAQRDTLVALARAVFRAQQLLYSDQQAAVEAILDSGIPDLDRGLAETIVEIYAPAIPTTPDESQDGVMRAKRSSQPTGPLPILPGSTLAASLQLPYPRKLVKDFRHRVTVHQSFTNLVPKGL